MVYGFGELGRIGSSAGTPVCNKRDGKPDFVYFQEGIQHNRLKSKTCTPI